MFEVVVVDLMFICILFFKERCLFENIEIETVDVMILKSLVLLVGEIDLAIVDVDLDFRFIDFIKSGFVLEFFFSNIGGFLMYCLLYFFFF